MFYIYICIKIYIFYVLYKKRSRNAPAPGDFWKCALPAPAPAPASRSALPLPTALVSSSAGHTWILVATNYFTRWVEAVPLRTSSNATIVRFLEDNILTKFSVPQRFTTDNASVFRSVELLSFCSQYGITLAHASNYYP
jgi:transposase InsO family protein